MVDAHQKEELNYYQKLVEIVNEKYDIKNQENISDQLKKSSKLLSVPVNQLDKTITRFLNEVEIKQKTSVKDLFELSEHLFNNWKKTIKTKKTISQDEIKHIMDNAESIPGTEIKVIAIESETESTTIAGEIIKKNGYVIHIYDGKKLTSAASEDVDIDLRKIAPEIGKILGGSGGGKPKMTQSGGPNKNKIKDALATAKMLTIKALS